jgi:trehalose synthase
MRGLFIGCAAMLCAVASVCAADLSQPLEASVAVPAATESEYLQWLEEHSMLYQAEGLARRYSGNSAQWQRPYGVPQPRAASSRASVWFTAYPASTLPASAGASVLATLADERLWTAFQAIGIQGIHTGPMKRSGGISGRTYTPSVDGNFDRISLEIDPEFGTEEEYKSMVQAARTHGAITIGDVIPGHTGKGADFRLAERAYSD